MKKQGPFSRLPTPDAFIFLTKTSVLVILNIGGERLSLLKGEMHLFEVLNKSSLRSTNFSNY